MVKPPLPAVKSFIRNSMDFFFPPRCPGCHTIIANHATICHQCWYQLQFISAPCCQQCGIPFEFSIGQEDTLCGDCITHPPFYTQARAALKYDDGCSYLITGFKYSDQTHYAALLSQWLQLAGQSITPKADVIIPVPLHSKRLRQRKYNQSALLAKALGKKCNIPVFYDGLLRIKNTPHQAGLSRSMRKKNLQGAILFNEKYRHQLLGKTVILVDDVMTTGTTLDVCSRTLKKSGIKDVYALTIARTVKELS